MKTQTCGDTLFYIHTHGQFMVEGLLFISYHNPEFPGTHTHPSEGTQKGINPLPNPSIVLWVKPSEGYKLSYKWKSVATGGQD